MSDSEYRRIFAAQAPHLAARLLRSSLTHDEWARCGPRRRTTIWGTWTTNTSPLFGITHLAFGGEHLDKHRSAHGELHQALHDVIDAMEMLEKLAVVDEGVRVELSRKLTRARMHLREARQD